MNILIINRKSYNESSIKYEEEFNFEIESDEFIIFTRYKPLKIDGGYLFGYKFGGEWNKSRGIKNLTDLDNQYDGKYLYINFEKEVLYLDPLGLQPLFISNIGISDSKKTLWKLKAKYINMVPPNKIFKYNMDKMVLSLVGNVIDYSKITNLITYSSIEEVAKEYIKLVSNKLKNIKKSIGSDSVYISFSGGIDSSFLLFMAKRTGFKVTPVTATIKGGYDEKQARTASSILGIDDKLIIKYIDRHDLNNIINLLETIETPNIQDLAIGYPLYLLSREIVRNEALFVGQGSDELFGGYEKYLKLYNMDPLKASKEMLLDIMTSYRFNFRREYMIANTFNVKLYYPLISPGIILLSLASPITFKIRGKNDIKRKWIIRKAAEIIGLPDDITYRRKKALQYSSGSLRILKKILGKKMIQRKLYEKYWVKVKGNS